MKNPRFYLLLAVLMVGTMLAACGDNTATTAAPVGNIATITPKPATNAATTPATTTADIKTTTAAARTGNSTTTLEELNFSQLPAGFSRFPLNSAVLTFLKNELKDDQVLGKDDSILKAVAVLGTDESNVDVAGAKFDTTVRAIGYTFAIPGYNSMLKLDFTLLGAYSKAGIPDLVVIGVPSADFLDSSGQTPLPEELANFARGKKFVFVAMSGTNIAAVFNKANNFPSGMPTIGTK